MNTHPSFDPGPAQQVVNLFQPVTSSETFAAASADQPVTPINGHRDDGETLFAPAPPSGYRTSTRWWTGRAASLVTGTQGAVIALVASAALVLVVTGITMSTNSSSTESPLAGLAPGRLPAPETTTISDPQPVTAAPVAAPAGVAQQEPVKAYVAGSQPGPPAERSLPVAHRALPAQPATPNAPDHGPVPPPPSSPPSSPPPSWATTGDSQNWTFTSESYPERSAPEATGIQPCCDDSMRRYPNRWDPPSRPDQQRDYRAPRTGYRSTSPAEESRVGRQYRFSEQDSQAGRPAAEAGRPAAEAGRPAAEAGRPAAEAGPRPSPGQRSVAQQGRVPR